MIQMELQLQLFTAALGIEAPLFIERVDFSLEESELNIYIDFKKGATFTNSKGEAGCKSYDTERKTWRHLNFFQYKCYLHFRTPYIRSASGHTEVYTPVWASTGSGFTLLFESFILTLAPKLSMSELSKMTGETDKRLYRVVKRHVTKARAKKDYSKVEKLGVDETSSAKGHTYVTVCTDMETREVIYVTPGKDASTMAKFVEDLKNHGGDAENIQELSMDLGPAYISGAKKYFPSATITFDKFHIIKLLNAGVDAVRKAEQKENGTLKHMRWTLLKNPSKHTAKEANKIKDLSKCNKRMAKAYQMKVTFQEIYDIPTKEEAEIALKSWGSWAVRSRLEPIKKFWRTVQNHWDGILNYFDTRLTAGISEGINSRIQEIKRRGRGYRNIDNFISLIYLSMSNLDIEKLY